MLLTLRHLFAGLEHSTYNNEAEASEPIGRYLTEQAWPKQREDLILAFHHRTILRLVQTFSAVTE